MLSILKSTGRSCLSKFWVPSGGIAASSGEDAYSKLIRAGFLRQAHSGIFHLLPLGRRVQDKLEALIDRYMAKLDASKVALSSISSDALWATSGRLNAVGSELFRFKDRKDTGYLLSPTHEEEITFLVGATVKSYKELPLRLYQISRKYRDELRPRHGLLRSREFVMKDLYTFDFNSSMALSTYHEVREVYARLFDELKIPYLVAEADSGDMGGNLSHEFHFPTIQGEDHIISCSNCNYVANEELVENVVGERPDQGNVEEADVQVWRGISRDKLTLINVWHLLQNSSKPSGSAKQSEVNIPAVRAIVPEVDASIENPLPLWTSSPPHHEARRLINLIDFRLPKSFLNKLKSNSSTFRHFPAHLSKELLGVSVETYDQNPKTRQPLNLLRSADGDPCPRCANGSIKVQRAIELGHTFYLGTRYSDPLKATVAVPTELLGNAEYGFTDMAGGDSHSSQRVPMQMGCHGIGVTRMIGAVADSLADEKGLNWPRAMAPFEAIIVASKGLDDAAVEVYDLLSKPSLSAGPGVDLVLDDRIETFAWKMRDADLVGYPIIIIVGRRWKVERMCEVQCRRLHICTELPIASVQSYITSLLNQL